MNKWKISDAKARFTEVINLGKIEPQIIMNRNKPVAALIDYDDYEDFDKFLREKDRPTVSQLLMELSEINQVEEDFDTPARTNRELPNFD